MQPNRSPSKSAHVALRNRAPTPMVIILYHALMSSVLDAHTPTRPHPHRTPITHTPIINNYDTPNTHITGGRPTKRHTAWILETRRDDAC